jgi:hypothetical protein
MENLGYLEGEQCNRDGCKGIIVQNSSDGSCSCHISPPCSTCCNTSQYCEECGWDNEYEYSLEQAKRKIIEASRPKTEPIPYIYDERKIYSVYKYFDTYYEGIVRTRLSEKEAYEEAEKLSRNTAYVTYQVRKSENKQN